MSRLGWGGALWLAGRVRAADRLRWVATVVASALVGILAMALLVCAITPWQSARLWGPGRGWSGIYVWDFLGRTGTMPGGLVAVVCLAVPVGILLGQAARIGMPVRARRLTALRSAGASARDLRRVGAAETALASFAGGVLGVAGFAVFWRMAPAHLRAAPPVFIDLAAGDSPGTVASIPILPSYPLPWWTFPSAVAMTVVVGLVVGSAARREHPSGPMRRWSALAGLVALVAAPAVLWAGVVLAARQGSDSQGTVLASVAAVVLGVVGFVNVVPGVARALGRMMAAGTDSPVLLLAGRRMQRDPRATSRPVTALAFVVVLGAVYLIFWPLLERDTPAQALGLFRSVAGFLVALMIVGGVLAVVSLTFAAIESVMWRRRSLARQAAAGVPLRTLRLGLVVESALPAAVIVAIVSPTVTVAGVLLATDGLPFPWSGLLILIGAPIVAVLLASALAARAIGPATDLRELRVG